MGTIINDILHGMNPAYIIEIGGILLILLIVFAETGLFFGFFLPGDSLLFTAGLLTATGILDIAIIPLLLLITGAAIIGDNTGYWFGRYFGAKLYDKKDSLFFKRSYLKSTESFYLKYGGMTLVLGRFFPIIRTFAPILAGTIKMDLKRFTFYNIAGGMLWAACFVLSGYFLGLKFPQIIDHLEFIIIGIGIVTLIPILKISIKNYRSKVC